ncbi:7tm 6 domain containing protein [Asbolus verrucosus]|uniref:7tm 6 domain containing protein n=1 Tax=Asbolus verrucosus TaxID=1661398 RepID=A0A482VX55_ASBVE|nr:7tm 6 domain containing protein [Asbolus verrucosus]
MSTSVSSRVLEALVVVIFVEYWIIQVLQSYYLLKIFETRFLVNYSAFYFGDFVLLTALWTILSSKRNLNFIQQDFILWNVNNSDEKIYNKIKNESNIVSGIILLNFVIALAGGFVYMTANDDDEKVFFIYWYIKENFLEWSTIMEWVIRASHPFTSYFLVLPIYMLILKLWHIKFQVYLLLDHIEKIGKCPSFSDKRFQKEIKTSLVFCIKRHISFLQLNYFLSNFVMSFSICGGLVFISLVFFVLSTQKVFDCLKFQKWYDWNDENKRLYLIFMIAALKPLRLQFSDNIVVNYELAISILKTTFSVLSVLKELV